MLRALWFFVQISIVVCAAIWIIAQKGAVQIEWNEYSISLQLGIFLLALLLFTLVALLFFKVAGSVIGAPDAWSRRRREKNRKKGFRALTRGFVAIAAGDARKATGFAKDARKYLPDETGLPFLLEAQTARLRGEEGNARNAFEKLLGDKDAAFFGIRGLLKSSLDEGDTVKALGFANAALEKNPKQPWILKSVYDLQLQNRHWHAAFATLPRARKYKAIDETQGLRDEVALLMILAEEDRIAHNEDAWLKKIGRVVKLDPSFVPAIAALCEYYLERKKDRKVISIVERAWKLKPHPDLAKLWDWVAPENKASDPLRRLRWFEKLVAMKPDSADGQIAAAKAAMDAGLAGEARGYLAAAEALRPTAQVYRLYADLEEQTTRSATEIRRWMDRAASAVPDAVWHCTQTGAIYEKWSAVAQPQGLFNSIEWGNPQSYHTPLHSAMVAVWGDPMMIDKN